MNTSAAVRSKAPPINELVAAAAALSGSTLAQLGTEFPELADVLQPGIQAGVKGASEQTHVDQPVTLKLAYAAARLLGDAIKLAENHQAEIEKRLKWERRVALASQLIATTASASVLALIVKAEANAAAIGAGLSFLASVAAIVVSYLGNQRGQSLADSYLALRQAQFDATRIRGTLTVMVKDATAETLKALDSLVRDANEVASRINTESAKLGSRGK